MKRGWRMFPDFLFPLMRIIRRKSRKKSQFASSIEKVPMSTRNNGPDRWARCPWKSVRNELPKDIMIVHSVWSRFPRLLFCILKWAGHDWEARALSVFLKSKIPSLHLLPKVLRLGEVSNEPLICASRWHRNVILVRDASPVKGHLDIGAKVWLMEFYVPRIDRVQSSFPQPGVLLWCTIVEMSTLCSYPLHFHALHKLRW